MNGINLKRRGINLAELDGGSGDAKLYEEITYSALKAKRDGGTLTPGQLYRITDYHTTTVQENTRSADHQFDIIVTALDESTLLEEASAILHEGDTYFISADAKLEAWKIWYCLDNDTDRFAWADAENGTGVIYRMIDEWNNDCPYDFKNIQFKRKLTDGAYDPTSGTDTWVYTFTWVNESDSVEDSSVVGHKLPNDEGGYSGVFDNIIRLIHAYYIANQEPSSKFGIALNGIVFISSYNYESGPFYGCYSNTFGDDCYSNTFGNNCYSNTFGNGCYSNTFGNYCSSNTFGNNCSSNTFGNNCSSNTFGNECYSNTFGNDCYSNTFGNGCHSHTFGNDCHSNTFGNGCHSNTFGNDAAISYCRYIALGDGVQYCKIYGTTTPTSSAYLQNIRIAQGLRGVSSSNKIAISVPTNREYETYVGKNSDGTLVMKCLLDSNS